MSEWIKLDRAEFDTGETRASTNGVEVTVFLSPYDIPEAVKGEYNKEDDLFRIEFKYITDSDEPSEPLEDTKVDNNFRFFDGVHSHRIYKIEIDIKKLGIDQVQLQLAVAEAIEKFDNVHKRPSNRGRYSINREVVQKRKDELYKGLVGAT